MKRTKYSIIELKELVGGEAFRKAMEYIRDCTGIEDEEDAMIEAEAYQQFFYKNGNPVH